MRVEVPSDQGWRNLTLVRLSRENRPSQHRAALEQFSAVRLWFLHFAVHLADPLF